MRFRPEQMSTSRSATTVPPPPATGEILAGKYRVERQLGEGGMGAVFAARHELLDAPVAVKLLSSELVRNPRVIERFLREARAVARLKSEHVARVMDVGILEDGRPYIVMELLEGSDVERLLASYGPFGIERAVDCVLQSLEAMAHAHSAGIVHRDLKPANLFMTRLPDGRDVVKVLDFGIAKLTDAQELAPRAGTPELSGAKVGSLTGDRVLLGSPSYMSPEQVRNARDVDARTDIWSLGAILHELLTGKTAFPGYTVPEIFEAVLEKDPPSIRGRRPQVDSTLEATVRACLSREREGRPADVATLARRLAPHGSGGWSHLVPLIEKTLQRGAPSDRRTSVPSMTAVRIPPAEPGGDELADTQQVDVPEPAFELPPPAEEVLELATHDAVLEPEADEDVEEESAPLSVPPPPVTSPGGDAPVVLVVDDDDAIRQLVIRTLASRYTVYEARDGQEALELLAKIPNPDAMVCDVTMPRMDGFTLGKHIKKDPSLRAVPIVFLTARTSPLDVVQAINSGARHHLGKPFKGAELLEKVAQAMGRKSSGGT